jgi:hypothetical protein
MIKMATTTTTPSLIDARKDTIERSAAPASLQILLIFIQITGAR